MQIDTGRRVHGAIWENFTGPVRVFLNNKYVFEPFWSHLNQVPGYEDWEERFEKSKKAGSRALANADTVRVLEILFDRLYVLRNQIMHGGATWNSSVNRAQVRDGARIMKFLVPVFVDLMMDNPHEVEWEKPYYPIVD